MIENELYVVKEYKFDNPPITEVDSIIDSCYGDCYTEYFHFFSYECIYDNKLRNITNIELINLTTSGKSMSLYELNKKLTVVRQNGIIYNQINKLTIKIYSSLRYINISFYLKFPMPMCYRQFFRMISQNREHIFNYCHDEENLFQFACWKWYS